MPAPFFGDSLATITQPPRGSAATCTPATSDLVEAKMRRTTSGRLVAVRIATLSPSASPHATRKAPPRPAATE
jgi:hypothetical protein